jgi:hypothetical protein
MTGLNTWSEISLDMMDRAVIFPSNKVRELCESLDEFFELNEEYQSLALTEYPDEIKEKISQLMAEPFIFTKNGVKYHVKEYEGTNGIYEYIKIE